MFKTQARGLSLGYGGQFPAASQASADRGPSSGRRAKQLRKSSPLSLS